jgi:hypothetical protein
MSPYNQLPSVSVGVLIQMHAGMWPEFEYELGDVKSSNCGLCFASLLMNSKILSLYGFQYIVTITFTPVPVSYALYRNVMCVLSACALVVCRHPIT